MIHNFFVILFYSFAFPVTFYETKYFRQRLFPTTGSAKEIEETEKRINGAVDNKTVLNLPANDRLLYAFQTIYIWWSFAGFLTSQWPMFLLLEMLALITVHIKKTKSTDFFDYWMRFDSFFTLILLFSIILNKFILHIGFYFHGLF